jgi:hypothetical protein
MTAREHLEYLDMLAGELQAYVIDGRSYICHCGEGFERRFVCHPCLLIRLLEKGLQERRH